ncbi:DUF349 domain-containing protein [Flavobacterium aciduliphilum]|uniref:Uncharacterized protein DUF349 n=1 Tax=Flavobacterium aciduliphilum TaxID=1101402 RepID=A0A328YXV6_9FLAO|nr:DUF349 domain-containing protein [Flavobacterium aciduliphilum]RAR75377.1 uncharacterized protein DUF349 [Flavobacterium aciduliphilum]
MSEEMNDNLPVNENLVDGNANNESQNVIETENQPIEIIESSTEETVEVSQPEDATEVSENDAVIDAITNLNAEESEDESLKERYDMPLQDFEALPMEKLVDTLEELVAHENFMSVREHVEEVKKAFLSKFYHLKDEKKDEFFAENPETTEEFQFHFPLKTKFDTLYNQYRDKKAAHFKSIENNLKANLEKRMAIVEELKNLVHNPGTNIANVLKQLNDIRDRWKNAGPIPKDKYNHVWNNYHFHIENFYDFLHLDREARDIEFKNNLEHKQRIIARVTELLEENDINKAFRELQDLHKIWKEDIGPVSKEHREALWNEFSDLTKKMHDKREAFYESFRMRETHNLEKKNAIIAQLEGLAQEKVDSHQAWLGQIEKVEALRNEFFSIGKVPSDVNEATWTSFKTAVRNFNVLKNSFYKEIKKDQNENLAKKQALIAQANELKDSEDFAATTPIMKQIQEDWKLIGHVPRKFSDDLWKEFRAACNHYFERLKDSRKEENAEELAAFEKKKEYLESMKSFELVGNHKTDLDAIKAHIEAWKSIGKVPFNRRHIEGKFNKILDALFEKLSSSKKESEQMRFANKLDALASADDSRKLDNEKVFIIRKIEEVQNEIFQLENNIQFFQNTKNAKKENAIVVEVRKTIQKHKEELQSWKDKLKQINELNKQA